jgi:hypothetical protein
MSHHYAKKYNEKQKEKLINEFLENKEKYPNYSLIKYVREKGIKENTFFKMSLVLSLIVSLVLSLFIIS